jgi:hypothetical protein
MTGKPGPASADIEKDREEKGLPEEDRDAVRRFAEFLRRRKDHKDGKPLPPPPEGMREWLAPTRE